MELMGSSSVSQPYSSRVRKDLVEEQVRAKIAELSPMLPFPGEGESLVRWQRLMAVGAVDLSVAKTVESHFDAIAIIHEAQMKPFSGIYAVWASKFGGRFLKGHFDHASDAWAIEGQVTFASAASLVDYALIPVATPEGEILFQIPSHSIEIEPSDVASWHTPGMIDTDTVWVKVKAQLPRSHAVGKAGFYLERRGFWVGGIGVAALWLGAAQKIFATWHLMSHEKSRVDPFEQAARAECFIDLECCSALVLQAAELVDNPKAPISRIKETALMIRHLVDKTSNRLIEQSLRNLGPMAMIAHSEHSRRCLDLQIFTRQCHAERDLAELCRELDNTFAETPIGAGKVWFE